MFQQVHLRYKFHFSDIHRSNALGPCKVNVTSKAKILKGRHVNFVQGPLRSYFDECQKNEIYQSRIYLHFIFFTLFCSLFVMF